MSEHNHIQTFERRCDVAVIGGSAAGLAAALQIVRQRRSVIVVDNGSPRNAPAAHMHSYLGYEGAAPGDLMQVGRNEVQSFGGEILSGTALRVTTDGTSFKVGLSGGHALLARRVLVATGVTDELPQIPGLSQHWGSSVISCPFCHGYEVRERRIIHIVTSPAALHTAPIFRSLSNSYSVVLHETSIEDAELERLQAAGIDVMTSPIRQILNDEEQTLSAVELEDGRVLDADAVVVTPRFHPRVEAFEELDLGMTDHPSGLGTALDVDLMGATSMAGIFAAGNVADPTLQVLPAAANGSRVGAAISMSLATEDFTNTTELSSDWDHLYSDDPIWSGNPNGTLVNEVRGLAPGRVLDVGAGEGGDALWLAENGWEVTATDVSSKALERVAQRAHELNLHVECLHRDASALDPFPRDAFELVSMQYGAIPRSPDRRGLNNIIAAVGPGGILLVVAHDLAPMRQPIDTAEQTRMWDPEAFVGVDEIAATLRELPNWTVECHELRPRPSGAVTPHVDDVILRARRLS